MSDWLKLKSVFIAIIITANLLPGIARGGNYDKELSFFALEEQMMVTATKTKKTLRNVPAIATVITGDEIRSMGARDIMDVLKMVPGFGVSINEFMRHMFEIRGVRTSASEKILLMIDGHRVNEPHTGSAFAYMFDYLSVEKIKQIEIIRGPGSALYGANAFIGVINVITKDAEDVDGANVRSAGGSFNSRKVGIEAGKAFKDGKLKLFGSFDYFDTNGDDLTIKADKIAGEPFSMTPGKADMSVEQTDAFLKLAYGDLNLKAHLTKKSQGSFIGFGNALTDDNKRDYEYFWTELNYKKAFTETLSASLRTYFDHFKFDHYLELSPEGSQDFPDGMIGGPKLKNRTFGTELQCDYDLFEGNHLIAGFNYEHIRQYDVKSDPTNFNPWTFEPLGSLQDVSSWGNFNKDVTRKVWAVYIQDEWAIRKNLNLTAGVRHDNYDDFGSTTNPRAGLVWNFLDNADLKLLYGKALRAPTFLELYSEANPGILGNPDLNPETISTYEISLGYIFLKSHMINVNYFYNDIEDLIVRDTSTSPALYANKGGAEVSGVEVAMTGRYNQTDYWKLAYTWQDPRDKDTDRELSYVPSHRIQFSANYGISKYLEAHTDILWTGERSRPEGDTRDDSDDYTTIDLTLTAKNFYKNLEVQLAIHNLSDTEYEDPDTSGAQQYIPYDYPREGISALFSMTYRF